jgi:excinuclease ABC subunit A
MRPKTLAGGAVKPWQTESNRECQDDLLKYARKRGVPVDVPWSELTDEQRAGSSMAKALAEESLVWRAPLFPMARVEELQMHVRVLLAKYRSYTPCPTCTGRGSRTRRLLWRLGARWSRPWRNIHDVHAVAYRRVRAFFRAARVAAPLDEATEQLLGEIRARLGFLVRVGLGYLTLDRQSRTLSGGEVQRINLTTALGTSLVNTLFVLDEPSIGLHPRDMRRVIEVMHRLRDNGNSLLVVEHDPQIMLTADRILDMGPGPGEHGGASCFEGLPAELAARADTLTAQYLSGRRDAR